MAIDPTQRMIAALAEHVVVHAGNRRAMTAGLAAAVAALEQDYELIPRRPDRVCGAEGPAGETCEEPPDHEADDHSGTVTMPSTWR